MATKKTDQEAKKETPAKAAKKAAPKESATPELKAQSKAPKAKRPGGPQRKPLISGTYFAGEGEVVSKWRLFDATNQPLGRLSSVIATTLMGKDKPTYTRHSDTGDFVLVINANKVKLTGNKWDDKLYHYHTGYPGGIKTSSAKQILETHPERLIEKAVHRMLPSGHMGRHWFKKLRVFAGSEHPHAAQKPEPVKLPNLGTWE